MAQLKTGSTVGGKLIATTDDITALNVNIQDSSNYFISTNVEGALSELFQSVSNGKNLIATTITDKGITTSSSDTFQIMANNILRLGVPDDKTNAPGDKYLKAGTMDAGFFGVVSASKLITGDTLASLVGISDGTSQFSNEGWLKFAYQGKIQFIAKKPIRSAIKWNSINTANCVTGAKTVTIGGLNYKVRLMKGATVTTVDVINSPQNMHYSEWNKLILPICIDAKTKSWFGSTGKFVEGDVQYWGIDFTQQDLHTQYSYGNGSSTLCQEVSTDGRLGRGGFNGIAAAEEALVTFGGGSYGWRPVLELV